MIPRLEGCVCACVVMVEVEVGGGVLSESQREGEASGKNEGMQSGVTLRGERSRVRRGSSGRDHHLPSLSLFLQSCHS